MKKALIIALVAAPLAAVSTAAFAGQPVDNYSQTDLKSGAYQRVVAQLEPIAKHDRSDESLLLNLAMAYRHVGRSSEATALYQRVLAMPEAELDTADGGTVSSHVLARRALAAPMQISQR